MKSSIAESGSIISESEAEEPEEQSGPKKVAYFCFFILTIIIVVILLFKDTLLDKMGVFSDWAIQNPSTGTFYYSLFYLLGIPLTLPGNLVLIFGAYIYTNILGTTYGVVAVFTLNFIFSHMGMFEAFLLGRYFFRSYIY
mmetsp:Transcript_29634/g.22024  ORF Transcript_29634/g.22024 Transcript_29634/m.22024 type:complete len:140 (+) Transcript_29634:107-526(+)